MFIFPLEPLPYFQNYAFREKFLTPAECDRVLMLQQQYPLQDVVGRKDEPMAAGGDVRKTRVAALPWTKDSEWVVQRLAAAVLECNKNLYNFQLTGFLEGLQLEQYQAGSFYDWHQDFGFREQSIRKLHVVVQLSEAGQYEGGDVEFFAGRTPQKTIRSRGALLIFPTFVPQRVAPVTNGVRHALTGWVAGPPFR